MGGWSKSPAVSELNSLVFNDGGAAVAKIERDSGPCKGERVVLECAALKHQSCIKQEDKQRKKEKRRRERLLKHS